MIEIKDHGRVRELRLARPPVNALSRALIESLDQKIMEATAAAADPKQAASAPRALVISGSPGLFCAGLDVREVTGGEGSAKGLVLAFAALQRRLVDSTLPVIAAITGHSPAGGAVIAVLCDYRIMAAGDFRIGLNEVQVGLYPGELIYRVYERLVGTRRAAALLPRGVMLRSDEALEAGLVDEVVAADQVVPRALALAEELIALPPKTYARTRSLVRADLRRLFDSPPESLESLMAEGWVTDETRERMARLLASR
ncbi:MAG: enoyl-CoA hydratase/isomerase family protein [Steroidobacteraceae bacterium]